jgi:hypothetical protein
LTTSWAADTLRIAPSGRQVGRRDRTKRRTQEDGGDTRRQGLGAGVPRRQRGRKVTQPGRIPAPGRVARPDPATPDVCRETSHRRSATCGRGPTARSDREPRDGWMAARSFDRTAGVAKVTRTPRGAPVTGRPAPLRQTGTSPGALEPEGHRGIERFGGRSPDVPRALLCPPYERRGGRAAQQAGDRCGAAPRTHR